MAGITGRATRSRSVIRAVLLACSAPIVALVSVLTLGSYIPRLPRVGVAGSLVWPTYIAPGVLAGLLGSGTALGAAKLGSRRVGPMLALVGGVATIASAVILVDQVRAARDAGAAVRPSTFRVRRSPVSRPDVVETYANDSDGRSLRADVYLPSSRVDAGAPVMVYVHGGGWIQGSPDDASADLRWFADHGHVVIAPEYSLATESRPTWDVAMQQIGTAIAWAGENAHRWGADPERIVAWGASAGANLALATTYAAAGDRLTLPGERRIPRVRAVAGEVPAVDPRSVHDNTDPQWGAATRAMVSTYIGGDIEEFPERLAAIRVNSYLSPAAPPTLLTACIPDHLVPVAGVRDFVTQATEAGVDVQAVYRRWGDHLISARYDSLPNQTMLHLYLRHFRRHGA